MATTTGTSDDIRSYWSEPDHYFMTGSEQCRGCGSLMAAKQALLTIYAAAPDAMVFGRSCGAGRSELQTGGRIACDGSGLAGVQAAMEARGAAGTRKLVILTGEGRSLEMGAGDFLASFDRGQAVTWIILDNQAYANTGSHATALTPLGSATRIMSRPAGGKRTPARDMPLMMVFSPARYVATAAIAYPTDLKAKVAEALAHQPSYVHVTVPCAISWGHQPDRAVELSRLGVQTGMTPLWSCLDGSLKRTVKVAASKREPVAAWLELQGRYRGVAPEVVAELQAHVDRHERTLDALELALTDV